MLGPSMDLILRTYRWYGESEFFFCSTKVLLLFGLVMLTFITMVGGNPHHDVYGFRNWNEGVMHEYYTTGTTGRFCGFFACLLYAAFNVSGPDLMALASGEIQNPRLAMPRIAKITFYRVVGFYIIGALGVSIICSSRDAQLVSALKDGASGSAASPWVIGIQNLGIHNLPGFINVLILMAAWSCGNAFLYGSSRALYSLAKQGMAPRLLTRCNAHGVPVYCVCIVALLSCITFLVASNQSLVVFYWFVDLTTVAFILVYTSMIVVFLAWYRAVEAQKIDLPWKAPAPFRPYGAILSVTIGCLIALFNGYDAFDPFDKHGFVTSYFGIAFAALMYFGYKIWWRTKLVDPRSADLVSGKAEVDAECRIWEEGGVIEKRKLELAAMPWWRRTWEKLW